MFQLLFNLVQELLLDFQEIGEYLDEGAGGREDDRAPLPQGAECLDPLFPPEVLVGGEGGCVPVEERSLALGGKRVAGDLVDEDGVVGAGSVEEDGGRDVEGEPGREGT